MAPPPSPLLVAGMTISRLRGESETGEDAVGAPLGELACFFQIRRAFAHIFDSIVGGSLPAAQLRAAVWQSLFTHDIRLCRRSLYNRMGDFTILISGPPGTGNELVARAIGLSRFIPFDADKQRFADDLAGSFHALNLSALL